MSGLGDINWDEVRDAAGTAEQQLEDLKSQQKDPEQTRNDYYSYDPRVGETRAEYRQRVKRASKKALDNTKDYQQAKDAGLVSNASEWDEHLINTGKATDIEDVGSGVRLNGKYMSYGEYDDWKTFHGIHD